MASEREKLMYQAIIVACLVSTAPACPNPITLETQRWHETERECKADALAMAERVHRYMEGYKGKSWRCRYMPEGVLTR